MHPALEQFHELTARWFEQSVGAPTAVQQEGWPVIARGEHALLSAPTGTGKTLSAFLWFIDGLVELARTGGLQQQCYVLYISPLKALGNDIRENLQRPLAGIRALYERQGEALPGIETAVRNGDTPSSERQRMLKRPPHILITTPESLYLLVTTARGRRMLSTVRAVIVDELHALLGSKRGMHLMLSLERLNQACGREVQRIGLSATVKPLELAAAYLAGYRQGQPRRAVVVAPHIRKKSDLRVELPVEDLRALPERSIWPEVFRRVYQEAQEVRTTLVFVEGRSTAEKVAHGVNELAGEGFARTHHGCVSKEQRLEAEQQLKRGELRCLVATSSMELGIDVGEIDLVVQIARPLSIAQATQRLGRAGHRPDVVSVMRVYPKTAADLLECALVVRAAMEGEIEAIEPPEQGLDVLAQHLVSMAADGEYTVEEAWTLARGAWSYRALSRQTVDGVLRMLAGDYEHDADRPVSPRVLYDRIHGEVRGNSYTRMLALSAGGTIPDRGWYQVVLEDNVTRLGELDEEFVFEARLGHKFLLGAFAWQIVDITKDRVIVRATTAAGARPPFWKGDSTGRPYATGCLFGSYLRNLEEQLYAGRLERALTGFHLDSAAALNGARYLREQQEALGCLATDRTLVVEHFRDEVGQSQVLVHSIFGGRVNQALALLLQQQAVQRTGQDVYVYHNDNGVLLHLMGGDRLDRGIVESLVGLPVRERLLQALPSAPLFSMAFRYNAARALMMGLRKGGRVPLWIQRIRGAEALDQALEHPEHPMLVETVRECMDEYMDIAGLNSLLEELRMGRVRVVERYVEKPSPMARELRGALESVMMYDTPIPGNAAQATLMDVPPEQLTVEPEPEQLSRAGAQGIKVPTSPEEVHTLLMQQGDLCAGELEAPVKWLEQLALKGRALYVEPGLWIAAERQEEYQRALERSEEEACLRLARRCLRYRGPVTGEMMAQRYGWEEERVEQLLRALEAQGVARRYQEGWVFSSVYQRAQRMTLTVRRSAVETAPPEAYQALVAGWQQGGGSPGERLEAGIGRLAGWALPLENWEQIVLPARTMGYRPGMLDELLARGAFVWRLHPGERPLLSFHWPEQLDWDAPLSQVIGEAQLTTAELRLMELLWKRGASFAHTLGTQLEGAAVTPTLEALTRLGLVSCDSFMPLRKQNKKAPIKRQVLSRVAVQDAGRWEVARPVSEPDMEQRLMSAFDRWAVLCRETALREGLDWKAALSTLRIWEYTGKVRRGYFVRTLSGAQFVREQELERVSARLMHPEPDWRCLCAADPAQLWGPVLKQPGELDFMSVPGTAVLLWAGRPALVFERQGAVVRYLEPERAVEGMKAFLRAFQLGQVWPQLRAITVKQWPEGGAELLEAAGFMREMRDYVALRG